MSNDNTNLNTVPISDKIGAEDILKEPTRSGFGEGLVLAGDKNSEIVALTADLSDSTKVASFQKKYPERFFEVGVAEQNLMGVAAGMALAGKVPFVSSYATFSPGRNFDQLRVSVCYSQANVKVIGAHTGVSVGPDGATHQAMEDLAMTRVLPNLTVVVPGDYIQTRKATVAIAEHVGPAYLRLTREKTPVFTTEETPFEIGKAQVLMDGTDVAVIGCGPVLYGALLAAIELKQKGISVMVVNNHTIKPIDVETIVAAAKKCGAVVTVEEHQVMAGAGSAVCEVLAKNYPVPVEMVGMQDSFGESGEPDQLIKKFGMDSEGIIKAIQKVIQRKENNAK